ncbi:thiamine-phosphate kinase [Croceicoccus estronivorus]|uniref:thiamine-phosphate kinase n=1 Tax=Croceicoccus estronivorus TaxID=1172626 RepID=UPI00082F7893|nr:thiamine-phosphate kinase [Croceicoccus estronivorus]OCC22660.1 thiamine-phosphate kinase [Croceicoccus estronivorus]
MNESDFIHALRQLVRHPGAQNLDDDCALLEIGTETLVLTHDAMAEDVHFMAMQDQADVAWKLITCNMSDLAAKGAEPMGVLLGYMLGPDDARFLAGLEQALTAFDVPLLGGDTIAGKDGQVLGLTAIGRATCRPVPTRSGARPGDILYITGPVGAAMMGYEALRDGTPADSSAYRRPTPLLAEGQLLAPHAHAMMDISDGLLLDSWRMAKASNVTIAIDAASVPVNAPEHRRADALRWGDDYQLLFALAPDCQPPVPAHAIGQVLEQGAGLLLIDGIAAEGPETLGYQHQPSS